MHEPRLMAVALVAAIAAPALAEPPRLVLQITVDGLRGDLIQRHADKFSRNGFNYLLRNGVVYDNAHYLHANTETIVGHTTLATGATPAVHGMVGNVWYQADSGELGYNIEDPDAPLLPTREDQATGDQVDPAQQRAQSSGRSPRGILAPTFSDTLALASGGKSKIFGISSKDRSAVAMAGQTGTAYWYSTDTGDFQSSRYYMDSYPAWVQQWNGENRAARLAGTQWQLMLDEKYYRAVDDRPYEVDLKGFGRTFPHRFGDAGHPLLYTQVVVSPEGDRLLLEFAERMIEAEQLGQDPDTDYLAISFSGVDAVNHFFGIGSRENEDVMLRLDATLEQLLQFIDRKVGLDETIVVLSADHGMPEMPEYATELGYSAGRMYSDEILTLARDVAGDLFDEPALVKDFFRPYLYLDDAALAARKLERNTVATALARALERHPGVGGAIASGALPENPGRGAVAAVRHNYHPLRSGDIYLFQRPYWFLFDPGAIAAIHGSPWAYDTHVPLIFAGAGMRPQRVGREVHPIDVAPTLSALLQIPPPAAAQGRVLVETLAD